MTIHHQDERVTVHHGDCLDVLRELPDNSVDAVVTDPPYGLEFMGKDWDRPWAVGMSAPGYGDAERLTRPSYGDNRNATCAGCGGRMRGAKRCTCPAPQWKPTGPGRGVGRQDVRQPGGEGYTEGPGPYGRTPIRYGLGGSYGGDTAHAMRAFQAWCEEWAAECLRVLKPGGHLAAFGGTRTYHRLTSAIEDAGFEIRDGLVWGYGSGFPKSLDVSKAIDKAAGAAREVLAAGEPVRRMIPGADQNRTGSWIKDNGREYVPAVTAPATDAAEEWAGWGTALKPSFEPIVLARKPLAGTVAANVQAWGTGALNIDACRSPHASAADRAESEGKNQHVQFGTERKPNNVYGDYSQTPVRDYDGSRGRWPTNLILTHSPACTRAGVTEVRADGHHPAARGRGGVSTTGHAGQDGLVERKSGTETVEAWECAPGCPVGEIDGQSGVTRDGAASPRSGGFGGGLFGDGTPDNVGGRGYGGKGGASRFFTQAHWAPDELDEFGGPGVIYLAKAGRKERPVVGGVAHPTVKPRALMAHLVRLLVGGRPDAVVLEPFAGSGTTVEACLLEGVRCVAIERGAEYLPLIDVRIARASGPAPAAGVAPVRDVPPPRPVARPAVVRPEPVGELVLFDGEAS